MQYYKLSLLLFKKKSKKNGIKYKFEPAWSSPFIFRSKMKFFCE